MDKINPNEYVRTIRGEIGIFEKYSSRKESSIYKSPFNCFIILQERKTHLQCDRQYIVKHSNSLKDLIEVRDIVNGYLIDEITPWGILVHKANGIDRSGFSIPVAQCDEDIEIILTHEMLEKNCYKRKENL